MADSVKIVIDLEKGDISSPFNAIEKTANLSGKKIGLSLVRSVESSFSNIGGILKTITGLAAGFTAAFTLKETIRAASEQEDAINRLNGSLKSSGDFSQQASLDLQEYASSLQSVTRFGDEVILNQLALAKSFGATNEQAKQIVTAASDLSAAFGIDLESATRNVAKTLGGYAGELGETIPQLKALTLAQLQAGEGIGLIAAKFAGQARNAVNTFSGAVEQTKNTFGDLLETFGLYLTQNPAVIKSINAVNAAFSRGIVTAKEYLKELDLIKDVILPIINFAQNLVIVFKTLELTINLLVGSIQGLSTAFLAAFAAIPAVLIKVTELILSLVESVGSFFRLPTERIQKLRLELENFRGFLGDIVGTGIQTTANTIGNAFSQPISSGLQTALDEAKLLFQQIDLESKTFATNQAINNQAIGEALAEGARSSTEIFRDQAEAARASLEQFQKDVNRVFNQGIARTVSGGIQTITNALTAGKNVFSDFGSFLLAAFGDLAIQLGEFYVATGLANLALLTVNPTAQIATGAALIALGSILKSFAGGGIGGVSGGGAIATNAGESGFNQTDIADVPRETREQREPSVSLNIQGSVFDSEETGTAIARILSDAFGKQGVTLTDARFAR